MIRYIAIFFSISDHTIKDIQHLSQSLIQIATYNTNDIISFDSPMTLNELKSLFENDEDNVFILSEFDNLVFGLPDEIIGILSGEQTIENVESSNIIHFETEEEYEQFFTGSGKLAITSVNGETPFVNYYSSIEKIEPATYVSRMSEEIKIQQYEQIISKLPNITEFEAEVLKILSKNDK